MKNLTSNKAVRVSLLVIAFALLGGLAAYAQDFNAQSMMDEMTTQVSLLAKRAVNLISVLIGFLGAIMLAWNYYKRSKGDGQSNDALASWGIGLLVAMVFLQVIKVVFLR